MATDIPERVRLAVLERDNFQCVVCGTGGENRLHLHHHAIPRSQGGPHEEWNLVTVCHRDHRRIHAGEIGLERWVATNGQEVFFTRYLRKR